MLKPLQDGVIFVRVIGNAVKSYSPTDAVGCCVMMPAVIMSCCVCSSTGCGEEPVQCVDHMLVQAASQILSEHVCVCVS